MIPEKMRHINEVPYLLTYNIFDVIDRQKQLVLFLDYDGTLSQITSEPDKAFLLPGMKDMLEKIASVTTLAIVSGRDTDDIIRRVGVKGLIYAGSHGFSINGPGGLQFEHSRRDQINTALNEIGQTINHIFLSGPEGVLVERKNYSLTVHYRSAKNSEADEIIEKTINAVNGREDLKTERGKMIIEIRPAIDWHKGRAVEWILEKLGKWNNDSVLPVYAGDDISDETAFRILQGKGIGIIVGSHGMPTSADFRLKDVHEVKRFLEILQ